MAPSLQGSGEEREFLLAQPPPSSSSSSVSGTSTTQPLLAPHSQSQSQNQAHHGRDVDSNDHDRYNDPELGSDAADMSADADADADAAAEARRRGLVLSWAYSDESSGRWRRRWRWWFVVARKRVAGLCRTRTTITCRVIAAAAAVVVFLVAMGVFLSVHLTGHRGTPTQPTDLGYATYQGLMVGDSPGVAQYLGIRYAAPPLGALRFRAPSDPLVEPKLQHAYERGPLCLATGHGYPVAWQDEDCLTANVWAPAEATNTSNLPVWVFIQGGGYSVNANGDWSGQGVVEQSDYGIVVVTFNYRVGVFGFLAGEEVRMDGDLNAGLLDQRLLLHWVQKHIGKFGGDPDHVVVHGMSAGAGSAAMHLAAYGGRDDNLFIGAMFDSVFFPAQPPVAELEYQFNHTLEATGCDGDGIDNHMECLRGLDLAMLQEVANVIHPFPGREHWPLFYWAPTVDGDLIRDIPYTMFERGEFVKVPILLGTDTDEGSYFAVNAKSRKDIASFLQDNYHTLDNGTVSSLLKNYTLLPPVTLHEAWFPTASQAYGEATFICPNHMIAEAMYAHTTHNSNGTHANNTDSTATPPAVYKYRYNVADAIAAEHGIGIAHGSQGPISFGAGFVGTPASYFSYNAPMVPLGMRYYASFVRALDPNAHRLAGAPEWRAWRGGRNPDERLVLELGGTRMETVGEGERARCAAWTGLAGVTRQ